MNLKLGNTVLSFKLYYKLHGRFLIPQTSLEVSCLTAGREWMETISMLMLFEPEIYEIQTVEIYYSGVLSTISIVAW